MNFFQQIPTLCKKVEFGIRKYSPEIKFGLGLGSSIAALIYGCYTSTKLPETMKAHKKALAAIDNKVKNDPDYSAKDAKDDRSKVKLHTGLKLAAMYGPVVALETASICLLCGSHKELRARLTGMSLFASALQQKLESEKAEREELAEENEYLKDPEGKKKPKKKKTKDPAVNKNCSSLLHFPFDERFETFTPGNSTLNAMTLENLQRQLQLAVESKRAVFLEDFFDIARLKKEYRGSFKDWGITRTYGWMMASDDEHQIGSRDVSLGLHESENENFWQGKTDVAWITLNCAPILDGYDYVMREE